VDDGAGTEEHPIEVFHVLEVNTSPFANTFATPTSTMLNAVTATEC